LRGQKNRPVGEAVANGHRFHVSDNFHSARIGGKRQRFIGRQLERFVENSVPDHFVNSLRIALVRREQIDNQQMNSGVKEFDRLARKRADGMGAVFVSWRNNSITAITSPSGYRIVIRLAFRAYLAASVRDTILALGGAVSTCKPPLAGEPGFGANSNVTTSASGPPVICSVIAKKPVGRRPAFRAAARFAVQV
jgi:hypothetical protein